jgi:hypothetical protein
MGNKAADLTGWRFGKLVVIERTADKVLNCGTSRAMWLCKCDCGNTKAVSSTNLKCGSTISCGCVNRENNYNKVSKMKYFNGTQIEIIQKNTTHKNNTTGVNGVHYWNEREKYVARIKVRGKTYHLGCYDKLEDAANARQLAEKQLFQPIIEEYEKENANV